MFCLSLMNLGFVQMTAVLIIPGRRPWGEKKRNLKPLWKSDEKMKSKVSQIYTSCQAHSAKRESNLHGILPSVGRWQGRESIRQTKRWDLMIDVDTETFNRFTEKYSCFKWVIHDTHCSAAGFRTTASNLCGIHGAMPSLLLHHPGHVPHRMPPLLFSILPPGSHRELSPLML